MLSETLLHSVRHEIKTFRRALLSEWAPIGQRRCLFHDLRWYAALFVLGRKVTADKVLEGVKGKGGTVLKTSLDHTKEAALQAALSSVQAAVPFPSSG